MRSKIIYAFSVNNRLSTPSEKQKKKKRAGNDSQPEEIYKSIWTESLKRPGPETVKAFG